MPGEEPAEFSFDSLPPTPQAQPAAEQRGPTRALDEVVAEVGIYSREAFHFVHGALTFAAARVHGPPPEKSGESGIGSGENEAKEAADGGKEGISRHISGRQLCEGLRELAILRWGLMARTVLGKWGVRSTEDFGRIVFALVENGFMSKTEEDNSTDFQNVFDFEAAFDRDYKIGTKPLSEALPKGAGGSGGGDA